MTTIDKKDIENIENLHKILKSKNLGSIKIKKGISTYSINIPRWEWAFEEGFTVEDISKSKILRKELFVPIRFSESLSYLT